MDKLHIDDEVLKFRGSLYDRLRTGKLSVEAFSLMLTEDDPVFLHGHTLYAMTEDEYWATRPMLPLQAVMASMFEHILAMEDLSCFSEKDANFIRHVKSALPTCPSCRKKRYMGLLYRIGLNAGIEVPGCKSLDSVSFPAYPRTSSPVVPKLGHLLAPVYRAMKPGERAACLNCVEKHVAQAYVLFKETMQGYPAHLAEGCAHLGEALAELPEGMDALRLSLTHALGTTRQQGRPFLPLAPILKQIQLLRLDLQDDTEQTADELDYSVCADELPLLKGSMEAFHAKSLLQLFKDAQLCDNDALRRLRMIGALGVLADMLLPECPETARMLRAARLRIQNKPDDQEATGFVMRLLDAVSEDVL